MQKNVCLQQDICLYPDKTLKKTSKARRGKLVQGQCHIIRICAIILPIRLLKKNTVALTQLHTIRSRSVAISLYQRVRGVYAIMLSLMM